MAATRREFNSQFLPCLHQSTLLSSHMKNEMMFVLWNACKYLKAGQNRLPPWMVSIEGLREKKRINSTSTKLRKSLVKSVTRQNISSCSVLSSEIVMHDDAYIGGCSENNIKCVVHDDLRWKNRTTRYILPHHWLYEWFSQFHRCGTYAVLSRSPSTECKVMINTDTGRQRPRPLHVHYPQSPFPSASLSNVYWLADPKPMFYVYGWRY